MRSAGACERAQIPVATTGVVQPRPKVSYGPSLTAGISGDREYIDLALERKVDDLGRRIRSELPEQLRLRAVQFMPRCSPSMQLSRVALAEYEAEVGAGFYEQVASREQDIARVRQWSRRIEEGLPPDGADQSDPINQLCAIRWNQLSDEEAQLEFTLDVEFGPGRGSCFFAQAARSPSTLADPRWSAWPGPLPEADAPVWPGRSWAGRLGLPSRDRRPTYPSR